MCNQVPGLIRGAIVRPGITLNSRAEIRTMSAIRAVGVATVRGTSCPAHYRDISRRSRIALTRPGAGATLVSHALTRGWVRFLRWQWLLASGLELHSGSGSARCAGDFESDRRQRGAFVKRMTGLATFQRHEAIRIAQHTVYDFVSSQ